MSLNIITKETILEVSKSLIDIIKEEENVQLSVKATNLAIA